MTIFLWNKSWEKALKRVVCGCLSIFVVISAIVLCETTNENVLASENLNMYATSYALMDGDTGRVLTGKNELNPMANASTTKILTCIVVLENCDLQEVVEISKYAASQPKVRLGMKEGEVYPLKDLIYGLMLESYNDCAVAIAEHVAGSEEEFSVLLNKKAMEIGCTDTFFITPNGLDREVDGKFHHSTAVDLCRMIAYCVWESPMKDTFLQITQTRNYTGSTNGKTYSFTNRNAFLDQMEGVLSGKTGFTAKAGYCYVAALEKDGERYCVALLACGWPNNKTYKWHDARILFTYGIENYAIKECYVKKKDYELKIDGFIVPPEFWRLNQESYLKMYVEDRKYKLLMKEGENIKYEIELVDKVVLPVEEGSALGAINVYLESMFLEEIPIYATESASEWKWSDIWAVILCQFFAFSS